jgi:hypothetical protein
MGIDDLRERIERLLGDTGVRGDRRQAGAYHDALVDLKVGIKELKASLVTTERELEIERVQLATAERRGKLAQDIGDRETTEIALTYAEKHRQRVAILERKVGVQRDELALAERDYEELGARYRAAKNGMPSTPEPSAPAAPPPEDEGLLKTRIDRKAIESAVEAQLEMLKKKLGRK